jgi:hypothetical protein
LWDVPLGRNRKFFANAPGIINHIVGGWTLNGIFNYQSGEPYNVNSGALTAANTHVSRADIIGPTPETGLFQVPGVIGPVVFDAKGFVNNCVETANGGKFCIPAPGKNGNQGRNVFNSPSYWNFDFGLLKVFSITERFKLQFRTEMFNAFNHVNFENPRNATVGSPTITSTLFGQTCCISAATPSTASILQLGEAPRVIQFALKLTF